MANEDNLRSRWTLEAEDPKAWRALNLAVERAKLSPGYRPGHSAAELELQARANDLAQRQNKYITDRAAKAREEFSRGNVGGLRSPEVDFSNDMPFVPLTGGLSRRRGRSNFDPTEGQPTRSSTAAKNAAAFNKLAAERMDFEGDQMRLRKEGQGVAKAKARAGAEQAARMANRGPIDAVKLGQGMQDRTMTRDGQTLDFPQGGHFDDTEAFGPRVQVNPRARSFEPVEQPVGDGDQPNDGVEGRPEAGPQPMTGAGGSWDEEPTPSSDLIDQRKPNTLVAPSTRPVAYRVN